MTGLIWKLLATGLGAFGLGALEWAWGHGDDHLMMETLTQQMQQAPREARWPFQRAALYLRHGDYQLALADLQLAETLDAHLEAVNALRAKVLFKMGQPAEARTMQEAYLRQHPEQTQVRLDLCESLVMMGDGAAALSELDAVLAQSETPPPDAVARRLELTEQQSPAEALSWLVAFLKQRPLPAFEETALRLELQLGQTAEALARLDQLITRSPRPAAFHFRKAEILAAQNQHPDAVHAAEAALAALDRLPEALRRVPASLELRQRITSFLHPPTTP